MWVRAAIWGARKLIGEEQFDELIGHVIVAALIGLLSLVLTMAWLVSIAFQPGGLWWLAVQNPKGREAFATVLAQHGWTNASYARTPASSLDGDSSGGPVFGPVPGTMLPVPPPEHWAVMVQSADGRNGCRFEPVWLAARAWDESRYGTNMATSSAGAIGYAQFLPSTWALPGLGNGGDPYNFRDAIPAMARYLCQLGIAQDPLKANFGYNHSEADVAYVARLVSTWTAGQPPRWRDLAALNQYDIHSWASQRMYDTWHSAACSAATLWWFAAAYGHPLANLDAAITAELPAIDPSVGLREHTGPGLAAAYTRVLGLPATNGRLTQAQLVAQLAKGPVALDGFTWFSVGHWFVAVAADAAGLSIRESSGHNFTHISWSQLSGEVGWDGWAVWVTSPAAPANAA